MKVIKQEPYSRLNNVICNVQSKARSVRFPAKKLKSTLKVVECTGSLSEQLVYFLKGKANVLYDKNDFLGITKDVLRCTLHWRRTETDSEFPD